MENFDLDIELKRLKPNSYYCGLLQNLYSGNESAINLLLQFIYDANILSAFSNDIAKLFYEFAFNELRNQYVLSQCIIMLGGDPMFINSQSKWHSGRSVDYVKDIKQILLLLIENNEKIILDYKTTISKIDDLEIRKHLFTILKTEKYHHSKLLELKSIYLM